MPVTHGVTGSSPVRTAININFQYFTKQTPNFTPENVKLGVCFGFKYFLVGMSFFLQRWIIQERGEFLPLGNGCKCHCLNDSPNNQSDFSNADVAM